MKVVWLVTHGEYGEGKTTVSVWLRKDKAIKAALAQSTCFEGGWKPYGEDMWRNGCDVVTVEQFEVQR